MEKFKLILSKAKNVLILTGAGISAESGIPTYRGPGGYWRKYHAQSLDSISAFQQSPSLVWEFYHYRRELVKLKTPNAAHYAITKLQRTSANTGSNIHLVTQNIDELHKRAGSENVIELHGSIYRTKCLKCGVTEPNYDSPICEGLKGRGAPDASAETSDIPVDQLPRCKRSSCNGLLRPAVTWFGEPLDTNILQQIEVILRKCDLCLLIGTSSVVQPAASFAPYLAEKGVPVAEFNLEPTEYTNDFRFNFQGPCTKTVTEALSDYI